MNEDKDMDEGGNDKTDVDADENKCEEKKLLYYLCKKYIISLFQHISSKTQPNLKNYGSFVNSFEFVSDLDQPGPCSFICLEMAAL